MSTCPVIQHRQDSSLLSNAVLDCKKTLVVQKNIVLFLSYGDELRALPGDVDIRGMYIFRRLEEQLIASLKTPKVLLLLGARQVGKTTLIEHILAHHPGGLLNMDIDVDRARLLSAAKLAPREAVRSLGGKAVLVIDEAQRVRDIGHICKGWYDAHVPTKIVLLGSSSATLLTTAAAALTGRNEKLWLTPLLFSEVLTQQSWFTATAPAARLQQDFPDQLRALLLHRVVFGSYPEAVLSDNPQLYLTNLSSDYLLKDIFTESLVRSPDDVRRLLLALAGELGNSVSVAQLATHLKLSRQTIARYLDLLESIFVIFSLPAYATDPLTEVSKSNKYYFWDTGVKNALQREWVVSEYRSDIDALWQNWVIAEILKQRHTDRRPEDLFFWRSRNNSTVDLVVKQGTTLHAFDINFSRSALSPSRSFERLYGLRPQIIRPDNILEFLR